MRRKRTLSAENVKALLQPTVFRSQHFSILCPRCKTAHRLSTSCRWHSIACIVLQCTVTVNTSRMRRSGIHHHVSGYFSISISISILSPALWIDTTTTASTSTNLPIYVSSPFVQKYFRTIQYNPFNTLPGDDSALSPVCLYRNLHLPSCSCSASRRAVPPKPTDRSQTKRRDSLAGEQGTAFPTGLHHCDLRRLWSLHRQPSPAARASLTGTGTPSAQPTIQTIVWVSCLLPLFISLLLSPFFSFLSSPSISVCVCI